MKQHLFVLSAYGCSCLSAAGVTFEAWSVTGTELFPSAIVSTATVDWNDEVQTAEDKKTANDPKLRKEQIPIYGDENAWLGVALFDLPAKAEVQVEISVEGYLKPSKWKGIIDRAAKEARIFPKAIWDYAALQKVTQQTPVNMTFKATVNGEALDEQTEVGTMKSINECPFAIIWDETEGDVEDISYVFAAYVNENHPWIDGLLKEALESELVDSFTGYQSGDPEVVITQVFAIWNVLQRRGIKYSDISTTTPSKFAISQTVRFLDDAIENTQANCVDGSVLMASILQKIGIHSYLVIVPGHCFLAFDTVDVDWEKEPTLEQLIENGATLGLETTMLGHTDLKPVKDLAKLPAGIKRKEFQASLKTFTNAVESGVGSIIEHLEGLSSEDDPASEYVSISDARDRGIMPLASGRDRK